GALQGGLTSGSLVRPATGGTSRILPLDGSVPVSRLASTLAADGCQRIFALPLSAQNWSRVWMRGPQAAWTERRSARSRSRVLHGLSKPPATERPHREHDQRAREHGSGQVSTSNGVIALRPYHPSARRPSQPAALRDASGDQVARA